MSNPDTEIEEAPASNPAETTPAPTPEENSSTPEPEKPSEDGASQSATD